MHDREQVRQLYDKMSSINLNLQSAKSNIENLKEELNENFIIDGNVVEADNVQVQRDNIAEIKDSVAGVVIDYLRSNC